MKLWMVLAGFALLLAGLCFSLWARELPFLLIIAMLFSGAILLIVGLGPPDDSGGGDPFPPGGRGLWG